MTPETYLQLGGGGVLAVTIIALVLRFLKKRNGKVVCKAGATAQETRSLLHSLINSTKQTNSSVDRLANSVDKLVEHVQTQAVASAAERSAVSTKLDGLLIGQNNMFTKLDGMQR